MDRVGVLEHCEWEGEGQSWTYRTVRAWSSIGAPEIMAAGVVSPGSLPSITRVGIGEKELSRCISLPGWLSKSTLSLRCAIVYCDRVVGIVCSNGFCERRLRAASSTYDASERDRRVWGRGRCRCGLMSC